MLSDEEIMAQVLEAFQEEQAEHRQTATDILLELEREPDHPKQQELLDQLFREAHSLKGGARAAGQEAVEQIAHRIEDVFSAVRQGKLQLGPDVCDTIYAGLDAIGVMMNQVAANQQADLEPHQHILDTLSHILGETVEPAPQVQHEPPPAPPQPGASEPPAEPPEEPAPPPPEITQAGMTLPAVHPVSQASQQQPASAPPPPPTTSEPWSEPAEAASAPPPAASPAASPSSSPATSENAPDLAAGEKAPDYQHDPAEAAEPIAQQGGDMPWEAVTTVRLSTATLDNLLNETGELITCSVRAQQRAREAHTLADLAVRWRRTWRQVRPLLNRIQAFMPAFQPTVHHLSDRQTNLRLIERMERLESYQREQDEPSQLASISSQIPMLLDALTQANTLLTELEQNLGGHARQATEDYTRLSVVTDRLHDQIRRTRMLPLTTLFSPLRLQMREIVRASGKQVNLQLDDGGAQADRQVLERLREVLLHLLRNAIDHGIEPPEMRAAHNKPLVGYVGLSAEVSGDYLTISIEDDGAGLDLEAIRQRALSSGVLSETDLLRASEAEMVDLIFLAGFSTRQVVSKMSGRGVGLDVVRSQVERMHGRVSVQSMPGVGCVFTISVPLSLTSSHGLLLRIDQSTYMLPLDSIQRIVSVAPSDVQILEGRTCLMIDERPLVLVHLADLLGKNDQPPSPATSRQAVGKSHRALVDGRSSTSGGWSLALLLGSGERQVACTVDAVLGEQELVVYRLPVPLQRVRFLAGATILADGSVVPILDVVDLVRAAIGVRHSISSHLPEPEQSKRRHTLLVVDDSITTRTLEKNILEAAGYDVKLATDGVEALEILRRLVENGGCDLLLSDIDMPRLNGFDLTIRVRDDAQLKHIPIVLVTSLDSPTDRERGINAGADAYIVKRAFDQQSLLETIERLI